MEAKDKNLGEEAARFFTNEIGNHRYQFDHQAESIACIKTIEKAEWQVYFENLFHNEVKRVDFRYNSLAHQE